MRNVCVPWLGKVAMSRIQSTHLQASRRLLLSGSQLAFSRNNTSTTEVRETTSKSVVTYGVFAELRRAAAHAFPDIPPSLWKKSFYYTPQQPDGGRSSKISLHDPPRPRTGRHHLVDPRSLHPWKRPPPGLDVPTITLDRQALLSARCPRQIQRLLWIMFASCNTATDILRVVALAMQREATASMLPHMHMRLIQACFRCRDRVSDQRICSIIRMVIKRLRMANLTVPFELYACGVKFAARSRSIEKVRWFLVQFRKEDLPFSRNLFRSVIAKCGIGHRGLGEIRNGKWDRGELRQVLLGFDDAETEVEKNAHLGTWLQRKEWQEVCAWWQILCAAGAQDTLKREWKLWKQALVLRAVPTASATPNSKSVNLGGRADSSFVRAMLDLGDLKMAWEVLFSNPEVWALLDDRTRGILTSYAEPEFSFIEKAGYKTTSGLAIGGQTPDRVVYPNSSMQ